MTNGSHEDDAAADAGTVTFDTAVPNPVRMWNYWVGGFESGDLDGAGADLAGYCGLVRMP